jgi:hypothetical protein
MEMGSGLLVMVGPGFDSRRRLSPKPQLGALPLATSIRAIARTFERCPRKCPRGLAEHPAEVLGLLRLQLRSHETKARSAAVADGRVAALPRGLPVATDLRDD